MVLRQNLQIIQQVMHSQIILMEEDKMWNDTDDRIEMAIDCIIDKIERNVPLIFFYFIYAAV